VLLTVPIKINYPLITVVMSHGGVVVDFFM
jgi:hypothetical protein